MNYDDRMYTDVGRYEVDRGRERWGLKFQHPGRGCRRRGGNGGSGFSAVTRVGSLELKRPSPHRVGRNSGPRLYGDSEGVSHIASRQ